MEQWKDFLLKFLEIVGICAILKVGCNYIYSLVYALTYKEAYSKGAHDMEVADTKQLYEAIKNVIEAKPESKQYFDDLLNAIANKGQVKKEETKEVKEKVIEGFGFGQKFNQ